LKIAEVKKYRFIYIESEIIRWISLSDMKMWPTTSQTTIHSLNFENFSPFKNFKKSLLILTFLTKRYYAKIILVLSTDLSITRNCNYQTGILYSLFIFMDFLMISKFCSFDLIWWKTTNELVRPFSLNLICIRLLSYHIQYHFIHLVTFSGWNTRSQFNYFFFLYFLYL